MGGVLGSLTESTGSTAAKQRRRGLSALTFPSVNPDETIPDSKSSSDCEEKVEARRRRRRQELVFVRGVAA